MISSEIFLEVSVSKSYAYDPLGRRVKTTAGGATVYHVYNGDECAADLDASGNPLRSYTFGQGIDNLLAMTVYSVSATNTYYAVKDHLGSVQALVDSTGNVVESFTYDAWGNILSHFRTLELSNFSCRYLFQGREYSTATGLYNFRARWYAPSIGRWLSKDPIGLEGGLNLYAFCGNDPVNFRDPGGLYVSVAKENQSVVLSTLSQFIRGDLSFDNSNRLKREMDEDDENIETMVDSLISSKNEYEIIPVARGVGGGQFDPLSLWAEKRFDWYNCIGEGGRIYYNPEPCSGNKYKIGFLKYESKTGGTILAHELLGRAIADNNKEPLGKFGSKTRNIANELAVERANPAFDRMNKPRRTDYSNE